MTKDVDMLIGNFPVTIKKQHRFSQKVISKKAEICLK